MGSISNIVRRYILLGLSLGVYEKYLVDTYYGPNDLLQALANDEQTELQALQEEASELINLLSEGEDIEEDRKEFLIAQLRAIDTTIRIQMDEPLTIEEKVKQIYGIEVKHVDEAEFEEAHRMLDALLPGQGTVAKKRQAYIDGLEISNEKLEVLCVIILEELRKRTRDRFGLPDGEKIELRFVEDKSYRGYCHYEGQARSILEINTDFPFYLHEISDFLAHEVYPGHHTEFSIKDIQLVQKQDHKELWISLMLSPQLFVSEMIATHARSVLLPDDEYEDWLHNVLLPKSGVEGTEIGEATKIKKARRMLASVWTNAVLMHWNEGADENKLIEYFKKYGLAKEEEAKRSARFAMDPVGHIYLFSYPEAYEALRDVFSRSDDPDEIFRRLLSQQLLPSTVHSW